MVIPGYREGTEEQHCGNCGASRGIARSRNTGLTFCTMYTKVVEKRKTCPKWYPKGGEKPVA
jgi:hypothetical protein